MFGAKPEFFEDADGHVIRKWTAAESSSYSNADLRACLQNRVAVEAGEMLGTVPPSAIKYCVTKGWLLPKGPDLYLVTRRAAVDLDLPLRFKGRKRPVSGPCFSRWDRCSVVGWWIEKRQAH
jgi:hypothetical protein